MIFFGTRGVTYSYNRGAFNCPACEATNFDHKRVRRFFTLYFIPIIPLDLLGEYIECDGCMNTFNKEVLDYDPRANNEAFEAEFQRVMRRVLVAMMLADGVVEPEEITAIQAVYKQLAHEELTQERIENEIHRARTDSTDVGTYLAEVATTLNDKGKELVLRAALMVAAADGDIADEELAMLRQLGEAMEMTPSHFKAILYADE